ncbi:MAG: LD-carboxypeptidase [Acidobacteria bacterium]|nr:LD-carboxypeptidase [Acidobacteriota bacterium]
MERRAFLSSAAALGLSGLPPVLKPEALRPGDKVGLITPATYVSDPDRIATAVRTLEYFGLKYRFGRNVRKREGYLGGGIEERADDLHDMFRDPEIRGVFCVRGGYGSAALLKRLDYNLIRANPKIFLGYSDITGLHLGIQRMTGLVTFHGPMALADFSEYTQQHFRSALFRTAPLGELTNPSEANTLRPNHTLRTVRGGRARGRLTGGNLTLISTTLGTPYEIDTKDRIVFLEDVGEEPYRIDRMLTHLDLAGKLAQAAGIIWGECHDCVPGKYEPGFESSFSTGEVVDRILGKLDIPVLSGLTIGHSSDQLTLPLGVMAALDADSGRLTVEESAVRAHG